MKCGYDHPTAGPALRALADKQRPVQEASTALFPALYAVPSCVAGTTYESAVSPHATQPLLMVHSLGSQTSFIKL